MSKSIKDMFNIFVADPNLSLMDYLDALREAFQGVTAIENATRAFTKCSYDIGGLATRQEHNGGYLMPKVPQLLQHPEPGQRTVIKLRTDEGDVWFEWFQFSNDFVRTPD